MKARYGYKFGNDQLIDWVFKLRWPQIDAYQPLWWAFAQTTAKEMNISRQAQDEYAINSHKRSAASHFRENSRYFEVIPVEIIGPKDNATLFAEDEECKNVSFDKTLLKTCIWKEGTTTAANASTITINAAAVAMSKRKMRAMGLKPIAKTGGFAVHDPMWFYHSFHHWLFQPAAEMAAVEIACYEINEAFLCCGHRQ